MRIKHAISAGIVAARALLTAPALANNSNAQPAADPPAAARCSGWPMEAGPGCPVRKSVPRSKPRANPPREVRTARRAEPRSRALRGVTKTKAAASCRVSYCAARA